VYKAYWWYAPGVPMSQLCPCYLLLILFYRSICDFRFRYIAHPSIVLRESTRYIEQKTTDGGLQEHRNTEERTANALEH
jgi:hypothetical protein